MEKNRVIKFLYEHWKGTWTLFFIYTWGCVMVMFFLSYGTSFYFIGEALFSIFLIILTVGTFRFLKPYPKIVISYVAYEGKSVQNIYDSSGPPHRISVEPPSIWILLLNITQYVAGRGIIIENCFIEDATDNAVKNITDFEQITINILPMGFYSGMLFHIQELNPEHEYFIHIDYLINKKKIELRRDFKAYKGVKKD